LLINFRQLQNLKTICTGLPIGCNSLGRIIVAEGSGKLGPLPPDMFDELGIPRPIHHAAFTPIEHELGHSVLDKTEVNAGYFQYAYCIATRLPLG